MRDLNKAESLASQVSQPSDFRKLARRFGSDFCMANTHEVEDWFRKHFAAPVTPVSPLPENIMHQAFDYQPFREAAKRIDEVIDTASLDEIRVQLRNLSTELKEREPVTPVSANETEPPDRESVRRAVFIAACKLDGGNPSTRPLTAAGVEVLADAAFDEMAGAASHNGQGWQLIEDAPKDGSHIQAADFSGKGVGFGGNPRQSYQCVVHWWQWCDGTHQEEWGWYPSTGAGESGPLTNLTHFKPLEELEK